MKKIHRLLQGRKGMTMAEVLVAFAIFAMLLLMFQRTVTLSSHVMQSSEDVRRQTERLYDAFYQQTAYTTPAQSPELAEEKKEKVQTYTFQGESGSDSFSLQTYRDSFTEGDDGTVHYIGVREDLTP